MRTLRRPMFRIGGKAEVGNDGIMSGLVDREELQDGTPLQNVNATFDPFYQTPDMDQLRAFQSIGMGNPFRAEKDMAGRFANIFSLRPADPKKDIISQVVESAPIVQKKKAAETALSTQEQLRPYQKYFSGNLEDVLKQTTPKVEVPDEDTEPTITTKDTGSNVVTQAEKNAILKARAREFEELLNPGARKRVINNALAAASAQFGKSTGNTMQDIANAITAAAGATGKIDETKQAAARLAIEEDIKKSIAQASRKDRAKGNYEVVQELALKGKEGRTPDEEILFKSLTAKADIEDPEDRFLRIEADLGKSRAVQDKYRDDENFAGVINNKKDVKTFSEDSVGKVVYHAPDNGLYKVIVNAKGELALEFLGKEKG
jgi:hypothetical protein